MVEEGQTEKDY